MVARARRNFNKPQRPQLTANARFLKRDAILFVYPKRQVLPTPAHHAVDRWDRPAFNDPRKGLALCVIELGRFARRLAVNQTSWSLRVEPENPVADDLQPDSANPRRILAAAAETRSRDQPGESCSSQLLSIEAQSTNATESDLRYKIKSDRLLEALVSLASRLHETGQSLKSTRFGNVLGAAEEISELSQKIFRAVYVQSLQRQPRKRVKN